jgi:3-methyl-2-oxobutanoate hydroxymethyltransferase
MTKLLDEVGVPLLLVGDSLGMVVLGYPDTTHVTLDDIEHHLLACARAEPFALLAADLPYQTYETPEAAARSASRLVAAGADAVKAEGGRSILPQVEAIIEAGIPFVGHLGMLPQHIKEEGGYKKKGRTPEEAEALCEDARALAEAGVIAIVLELVIPEVAARITREVEVPTIGIGSGEDCDGQILVTHDLIGTFPWFTPKFVEPKLKGGERIRAAVKRWMKDMGGLPRSRARASKAK